jgi:GTPase SAR1 family protein
MLKPPDSTRFPRSKDSFEHVKNKWFPEVSSQASSTNNAIYVLVGTKLDLRDGVPEGMQVATQPPPATGSESVSTADGEALATQLGLHSYVECSALTQDNLKTVFDTTIKAVLAPKNSSGGGSCCSVQ